MDEIPYDFLRKRLSVLVTDGRTHLMVTKGSLENVLAACDYADPGNGTVVPLAALHAPILARFEAYSREGYRTLGVALKDTGAVSTMTKSDEHGMTFLGFLVLYDPPKADIRQTIDALAGLGVALKMITGDNRLVAASVGRQMGLSELKVLTGAELRVLSDGALLQRAGSIDVFAEIEPNQKERIIVALKKAGNVVGYLGDGINDASALHAADVGISVAGAVDVAKEAADIVLLEKDLGVLVQGVREGRMTFSNTLKYVFMATSANFGNMFSMAGVSLFLPFLPLLPVQILLTNLLTDFPEMTIATDRVDDELVDHPRRWDIQAIRRFMLTFGLVSSVFDCITFGALLWLLEAGEREFRTGWFIESVVSAALVVMVIRTRHAFFRSRPSAWLLAATLLTALVTVALPYSPLGEVFGFTPLPLTWLIAIGLIVLLYVLTAEFVKAAFYRRVKF